MGTIETPATIEERREQSKRRIAELQSTLETSGALPIIRDIACVYATGSVARGEASKQSDLDLFIISKVADGKRSLGQLESIRLESRLIEASRACNFPDFSGDGEYLVVHDVDHLLRHLGTREDEHTNVFTARLLLLLESYPILGEDFYRNIVTQVVERYWRDYPRNRDEFLPVFLINDIRRYWAVLCVSYEAVADPPREPELSKRRLSNYKLKHSRLLICYSAIVYLCWLLQENGTVHPDEAVAMTQLRPLQRLEAIGRATASARIRSCVARLFEGYSRFLEETARPDIQERFRDDTYHKDRQSEAKRFGDAMYALRNYVVPRKTAIDRFLQV
jgi:predicted nucleotidyltransferase